MKKYFFTLIFLTIFLKFSFGQQSKPTSVPCSDPKYHQFDFWLGEWNVTRAGSKPNAPPAKSKISRLLDQCVIFEEYQSADGKYSGKSFNMFDSAGNEWRQFWVDDQGGYLDFTGHFQNDGALHFVSNSKGSDGKVTITRMTFSKLPGDKVHQYIDQSTDDGKTWTLYFDGIYVRRQ
jgi:hypothetical protein